MIVKQTMTEREARACVARIRDGIDGVRQQVLRLHEGNGWEALGYNSWRACVMAEFPQAERTLYQELTAAKVESNLRNCANPPAALQESHARELAKLKEPEDQAVAWQAAVESAPEGKLTARHVGMVVAEMLPEKPRRAARRASVDAEAEEADDEWDPDSAWAELRGELVTHWEAWRCEDPELYVAKIKKWIRYLEDNRDSW